MENMFEQSKKKNFVGNEFFAVFRLSYNSILTSGSSLHGVINMTLTSVTNLNSLVNILTVSSSNSKSVVLVMAIIVFRRLMSDTYSGRRYRILSIENMFSAIMNTPDWVSLCKIDKNLKRLYDNFTHPHSVSMI